MTLDPLFSNLATGRLLGRQTDSASQGQRDADGADARQFASLLSDLGDRTAPAARVAVDDATTFATAGSDDRPTRQSATDEAAAADSPSNAPGQMQAFVAVPAFDMNWAPSANPRPAIVRSDSEASTADAAPTGEDGSAPVAERRPPSIGGSYPSNAFATNLRAADDVRIGARAPSAAESLSSTDSAPAAADSASTQQSTRDLGVGPSVASTATMRTPRAAGAISDVVAMQARGASARPSSASTPVTFAIAPSSSDSGSTFGRITVEPTTNVVSVSGRDPLASGGEGADVVTTTDLRDASAAEAAPSPASSAVAQRRQPLAATAFVEGAASPRTSQISDIDRRTIEPVAPSSDIAPRSASVAPPPAVDGSAQDSTSSLASVFDVEARISTEYAGVVDARRATLSTTSSATGGGDVTATSSSNARGLTRSSTDAQSALPPVDREIALSFERTSASSIHEPGSIETNAPQTAALEMSPSVRRLSNEATFASARGSASSSSEPQSVSPPAPSIAAAPQEFSSSALRFDVAPSTPNSAAMADSGLGRFPIERNRNSLPNSESRASSDPIGSDDARVIAIDWRNASERVASARVQNAEVSASPFEGALWSVDPAVGASESATSGATWTRADAGPTSTSDVASASTYTSASPDRATVSSFDATNASTTYAAAAQRQELRAAGPQLEGAPATPAVATDDDGVSLSPSDARRIAMSGSARSSAPTWSDARPTGSSELRAPTPRVDAASGASAFAPFDLRGLSTSSAAASAQARDAASSAPPLDVLASTRRIDADRGEGAFSQFDPRSAANAAAPASPQPPIAVGGALSSGERSSRSSTDASRGEDAFSPFDLRGESSAAPSTSARRPDFASVAPRSDVPSTVVADDQRPIASFDLRNASASAEAASTQSEDFVAPASLGVASPAYVPTGLVRATPTPFVLKDASDAPIPASSRDYARSASDGAHSEPSLDGASADAAIVASDDAFSVAPQRSASVGPAAVRARSDGDAQTSAVSDRIAQIDLSSTAATDSRSADELRPSPLQQDSLSNVAVQTANGWRPQAQNADSASQTFATARAEPLGAAVVAESSRSHETVRQPQARAASPTASTVAFDDTPRVTDVSFSARATAPVVAASTGERAAAPWSADRSSSNDGPSFASDTAAPLQSFLDVPAPSAGAQGAEGSSSNDDRGSDRRAFVETSRRSASSGDMRPEVFDGAGDIQASADASLARADASNVSTTPSATQIDEATTNAAAPEPVGTLAILALPTQLPSAFAELLAPQARSLLASASTSLATGAAARAAPVAETQRQSIAPKILTIELEPASLGAVVVKMKLAHSGIDMRISVESTEALRRLDSTRDQLVEAMRSSGCVIDSCTIQIGQNAADGAKSQAAPDSGAAYAQSSGAGAGRDDQSVGRQGAGYGGQGGDRRRGAGGEANEPASNGEIRRVADRRGGDVYL